MAPRQSRHSRSHRPLYHKELDKCNQLLPSNSTPLSACLHYAALKSARCRYRLLFPHCAVTCFPISIFGRPLQVTVRPMLWDRCPVCLSVTLVYCGQTVGWIKMTLGTEVGLGPGDIVLDGDPAPLRKGAQ